MTNFALLEGDTLLDENSRPLECDEYPVDEDNELGMESNNDETDFSLNTLTVDPNIDFSISNAFHYSVSMTSNQKTF